MENDEVIVSRSELFVQHIDGLHSRANPYCVSMGCFSDKLPILI
jgi:hypothetical protein